MPGTLRIPLGSEYGIRRTRMLINYLRADFRENGKYLFV
jgi:hypothetical protein